jgi:hypothetical protein
MHQIRSSAVAVPYFAVTVAVRCDWTRHMKTIEQISYNCEKVTVRINKRYIYQTYISFSVLYLPLLATFF